MLINSRSLFVYSYIFLLLGFYLGEDLNGNAKEDYLGQYHLIKEFSKNYIFAFENYSSLEEGTSRQSPIFFFILSVFYKVSSNSDVLRFLNLNLSFLSVIIFYKCLFLIFNKQKSLLISFISIILVFSPSFRSLAIWPNSINLGLLLFLISIYFFLKFQIKNNKKYKYAILNTLFLAFSSYVSPNFSVFAIFFFYHYCLLLKNNEIIKLILINILLSFPAIYYVFIDNNYFMFNHVVSVNVDNTLSFSLFINKIVIISTIVFFHLLPFVLIEKEYFIKVKENLLLKIILISLIVIVISYSFNYDYDIGGGGIFFKISNFLFGNNYLFYFSILIIFLLLYEVINNKIQNIILLICLFLSNPQYSIYHKYFDPLVLIIWLLLFAKKQNYEKIYFKNKNIIILYLFYIIFIILNYLKSFI